WRRLLVKGSYTVDNLRRAISIRIDSGCCRTRSIKNGRLVRQPFHAAVRAGDGGSDGLLDLVCQRRGHFPQRAHTIDVRQFGLQVSQPFTLLLSPFLFAQIEHESDPFAPTPFEECAAEQHRYAAAIFPEVLLFVRLKDPARL